MADGLYVVVELEDGALAAESVRVGTKQAKDYRNHLLDILDVRVREDLVDQPLYSYIIERLEPLQ